MHATQPAAPLDHAVCLCSPVICLASLLPLSYLMCCVIGSHSLSHPASSSRLPSCDPFHLIFHPIWLPATPLQLYSVHNTPARRLRLQPQQQGACQHTAAEGTVLDLVAAARLCMGFDILLRELPLVVVSESQQPGRRLTLEAPRSSFAERLCTSSVAALESQITWITALLT